MTLTRGGSPGVTTTIASVVLFTMTNVADEVECAISFSGGDGRPEWVDQHQAVAARTAVPEAARPDRGARHAQIRCGRTRGQTAGVILRSIDFQLERAPRSPVYLPRWRRTAAYRTCRPFRSHRTIAAATRSADRPSNSSLSYPGCRWCAAVFTTSTVGATIFGSIARRGDHARFPRIS